MRLYTISEAAEQLGRSYNFVRRLIDDGHIPARTVNGRRYVSHAALTDWLVGEKATAVKQRTYSWKSASN